MAKKYMERIEALRQQYLSTRVDMDVYNAKYMTEGFKETEGQPWIIQKATGYARTCEKKQIYIQDHELLVGRRGLQAPLRHPQPGQRRRRHREGSRHDFHPPV